ncbi:MAG: archease [Nanoarchaeota archaeon]|nr:archease [Nanoarchaeota archaeon]MBU1028075.1 archease [Nanoarchaeota archaeon]
MVKFKFLEHTADIKFQAFGKSLEDVFKNSALAMFNAMYDGKVQEKEKLKFKVKGKDLEALMYNFLEELLFLLDTKDFFLSKIKVKINKDKKSLIAEVVGNHAEDYEIHIDVKAITYNEMFVKKIKDNWVSQVVLDV